MHNFYCSALRTKSIISEPLPRQPVSTTKKKKEKKIEEKIRMYLHMHQAVKLNLENYVYILTCHDRLITKNLSP